MKKWIAVSAAVLFLLAGCNNKDDAQVKRDKGKEAEEVKKDSDLKSETLYTYPLTGIRAGKEADERAIAVVVNNHPKARPQSGLHKADIVYELLAEGEVTRFLAVFQSEQPENIGPVRSARDYYIELANGFNGIFIAHGYSPEAQKMLESGYVDNLNGMAYDGTLFKRSTERQAPHNSYITYQNIVKGADQNHYSMKKAPPAFSFLNETEINGLQGKEAASVKVSYFKNNLFTAVYEYDTELRKYKRYSGGDQTIDLDSKEPVLLDNVFIVEMKHTVVDDAGHRDIDMTSGGKGYLLQQDKLNEVEWKNIDGRIVPFADGSETGFVPGKTWVNVIPSNPGLTASVSIGGQ